MAAPRKRRKRRSSEHDPGYKRLFSHPQTVEELLRGFLGEDWVRGLDFSTLERVDRSFVSDDLRARHGDLVWRLRWRSGTEGGGWLYLYLLLEFQSTSDHFMAVRLLTYVGLLLEQIIRAERLKPGDALPVVLPLVLYNGKGPWRAPLDLSRLFVRAPRGLRRHLPRLTYLLLDENRLDLNRPELAGNRVAALFRIETCRSPRELPRLTERLAALVPAREPELRRTFGIWLRSVLRRTFPGATIPGEVDLEEAPMLEQTLLEWKDKIRREGRREGRQEGRVEGAREVLLQMMEKRFGPLSLEIRERVEAISSLRRLKTLSERVLTAKSPREMGLR
jgi:hypothetical protein